MRFNKGFHYIFGCRPSVTWLVRRRVGNAEICCPAGGMEQISDLFRLFACADTSERGGSNGPLGSIRCRRELLTTAVDGPRAYSLRPMRHRTGPRGLDFATT